MNPARKILSSSAAEPIARLVMERQHWIIKLKKVSHSRLHADRSCRTGVDSFFDHLQFCFRGLERVFGSLRDASRIDQLDIRLLADLKQLRFDSDTVRAY